MAFIMGCDYYLRDVTNMTITKSMTTSNYVKGMTNIQGCLTEHQYADGELNINIKTKHHILLYLFATS